ncbi:MAG TPA: rhodanese-like domain-containing protein [Candidatus Acidoferrales bacterium]|nr:rhodanese-like domain-containing protein [Candidatus Acidoferrales bacterium]
MPREIDRDEVRRLLARGAQLVEVLPPSEYRRAHLPGALHIPLEKLSAKTASKLRKDAPVIVYCFDYQ